MKQTVIWSIPVMMLAVFSILTPAAGNTSEPEPVKTVAILPFETNAQKDISYIGSGILSMLHSRLHWKHQVRVIDTAQAMKALTGTKDASTRKTILRIGETTNADYIVTGIVTEFSGAFSIDTKVYDIKNGSFLTFYDQSETIDRIIPQVDIVAAKINKKVFDRTTVSFEKFKKERVITEEELRRMNPERMLPPGELYEEEEKPWWQIW